MKERGASAVRKRRWAEALKEYSNALCAYSGGKQEQSKLFSNLSLCLLRLGRFEFALAAANESAWRVPHWSKAHTRRAAALEAMELYDAAASSAREALVYFVAEHKNASGVLDLRTHVAVAVRLETAAAAARAQRVAASTEITALCISEGAIGAPCKDVRITAAEIRALGDPGPRGTCPAVRACGIPLVLHKAPAAIARRSGLGPERGDNNQQATYLHVDATTGLAPEVPRGAWLAVRADLRDFDFNAWADVHSTICDAMDSFGEARVHPSRWRFLHWRTEPTNLVHNAWQISSLDDVAERLMSEPQRAGRRISANPDVGAFDMGAYLQQEWEKKHREAKGAGLVESVQRLIDLYLSDANHMPFAVHLMFEWMEKLRELAGETAADLEDLCSFDAAKCEQEARIVYLPSGAPPRPEADVQRCVSESRQRAVARAERLRELKEKHPEDLLALRRTIVAAILLGLRATSWAPARHNLMPWAVRSRVVAALCVVRRARRLACAGTASPAHDLLVAVADLADGRFFTECVLTFLGYDRELPHIDYNSGKLDFADYW